VRRKERRGSTEKEALFYLCATVILSEGRSVIWKGVFPRSKTEKTTGFTDKKQHHFLCIAMLHGVWHEKYQIYWSCSTALFHDGQPQNKAHMNVALPVARNL